MKFKLFPVVIRWDNAVLTTQALRDGTIDMATASSNTRASFRGAGTRGNSL